MTVLYKTAHNCARAVVRRQCLFTLKSLSDVEFTISRAMTKDVFTVSLWFFGYKRQVLRSDFFR